MMNDRKALGKGISALIPVGDAQDTEKVTFLSLEKIKPNILQPRIDFNPQAMEELVQSIKEKGIIQPILVRKKGEGYEIIAGERRFRAANILNLKEIPVIVKEAQDLDSLELALIENIQRENLNAIEEAKAFQYLIDKFNLTQEKICDILGKSRASIANTLRLLKLPLEIQKEISSDRISFGHGRALLEIEDSNQQRALMQHAIAKSLSVRELECLIKGFRKKIGKKKNVTSAREPYVVACEECLQQVLATKVRVHKKKKRGHIVIDFYSQDDLERISKKICNVTA